MSAFSDFLHGVPDSSWAFFECVCVCGMPGHSLGNLGVFGGVVGDPSGYLWARLRVR